MERVFINFRLDKELVNFVKRYGKVNKMTVTAVVTQALLEFMRKHKKELEQLEKEL